MTEQSPYFDVVPARPVTAAPASASALASGNGWRVERQPDGLWLFYISGSHQGDERAVLIDEADGAALGNGERTLDDVLIARGAN